MVHKTCCKAVSVSISFAHRPTPQTTEENSHTAWVLFLSSKHSSWNNLWSSVKLPALPKLRGTKTGLRRLPSAASSVELERAT